MRYEYEHLGDSPSVIKDIANDTHPIAKKLKSAKKPLIIVGADVLEREDGAGVLAAVQNVSSQLQGKLQDDKWRVMNVLQKVASQVGIVFSVKVQTSTKIYTPFV